ncbi:MAG: threonylcarbamoyl-AMP synthase [Gammaproteobacteria bacterium]|nr:threonylcarbamoyl-AMP synthase [Gammaproteobacteria bacterium]MDX5375854.1 threonylcarbamoyl-AMP synthase [Gammaproteobacteria bacterium]
MIRTDDIQRAAALIREGGILAYPTEAVYGLGCDPANEAAVRRLLALKQRPEGKGLILLAADLEQLAPYITPLTETLRARILPTWPGPVTWVVPTPAATPRWLRGEHDSIAVRVTNHPVARALCEAAGTALVSTSANLSGQSPARSADEVAAALGEVVDLILDAPTGGLGRPTEIRDARDGTILRPGQ